jgi:hypothetical protein
MEATQEKGIEKNTEASTSKDAAAAVDLEKNATDGSLQRVVSGPPYSVFSDAMKMWIIFLVSVSALISPFAATTYYPALNVLSDVLHVTPTMTNVSITTYMVRDTFNFPRPTAEDTRLRKPSPHQSLGACPTLQAVVSPSSFATSSSSSPISDLHFKPTMLRFSSCEWFKP